MPNPARYILVLVLLCLSYITDAQNFAMQVDSVYRMPYGGPLMMITTIRNRTPYEVYIDKAQYDHYDVVNIAQSLGDRGNRIVINGMRSSFYGLMPEALEITPNDSAATIDSIQRDALSTNDTNKQKLIEGKWYYPLARGAGITLHIALFTDNAETRALDRIPGKDRERLTTELYLYMKRADINGVEQYEYLNSGPSAILKQVLLDE